MSKKRLFVIIRIPKSGSNTLRRIIGAALPQAKIHSMPNPSKPDGGVSLVEKMRVARGRIRRRWRNYNVLTDDQAWTKIAGIAKDGDIVQGHIGYGDPQLPGFDLDYVTIVRDPVQRLMSEYFYSRRGFEKRSFIRKLYNHGRLRAAASLNFSDYIAFLHDRQDLYANRATRFITGTRTCDDPAAFLMENYFHFGTLEQIDVYVSTLSEKLSSAVPMAHFNRSENREEIPLSAKDKSRLEDLYSEDMKLHRAAMELVKAGHTGRP
jgi:hypothetical protein